MSIRAFLCRWSSAALVALGTIAGLTCATAHAAQACTFDAIVTGPALYETSQDPLPGAAPSGPQLIGFIVSKKERGLNRLSVYVQNAVNCSAAKHFRVVVDGVTQRPSATLSDAHSGETIGVPARHYHSIVVQLLDANDLESGLPSRTYIAFAFSGWQIATVMPSKIGTSPAQTITFADALPATRSLTITRLNSDRTDFPLLYAHLQVGVDHVLSIALQGNPNQLHVMNGTPPLQSTLDGHPIGDKPPVVSSCNFFASTNGKPSPIGGLPISVQGLTITSCDASDLSMTVVPTPLMTYATAAASVKWDNQGTTSIHQPSTELALGKGGAVQLNNIAYQGGILENGDFSFVADVSIPAWDGSPSAPGVKFSIDAANRLLKAGPIKVRLRGMNVSLSGLNCAATCMGNVSVDLSAIASLKPLGSFTANFTDGALSSVQPGLGGTITFAGGAILQAPNGWSMSLAPSKVSIARPTSSALTWNGIAATAGAALGPLSVNNFAIQGDTQGGLAISGTVHYGTIAGAAAPTVQICGAVTTSSWSFNTDIGTLQLANGSPAIDITQVSGADFGLGDPAKGLHSDWIHGTLASTTSGLLNVTAVGSCNLQGLAAQITPDSSDGQLGLIEGHKLYAVNGKASCPPGTSLPTNRVSLCLNADILPQFFGSIASASDPIPATVIFKTASCTAPLTTCFDQATLTYNAPTPASGTASTAPHLRLGAISLQLKSATLNVSADPGSLTGQNFGLAPALTCSASMVGKMELVEDVSAVYSGPTTSTTSTTGPSGTTGTTGTVTTGNKDVTLEPEVAIGPTCFVLASEGAFGIPLSPQSSMTISHFAMAHIDYNNETKPLKDQPLPACTEKSGVPKTTCDAFREHLELAGLFHSGNLVAVVQNTGYDRDTGAKTFKMAFTVDKGTTLALNAANNATAILQTLGTAVGALVGGAIHL